MPKHQTIHQAFGCTDEELAVEIGNLRYDDLVLFFTSLSEKIANDAVADRGRGRPKLGAHLEVLAGQIEGAASTCEKIWILCAPFMTAELETPP